MKELASVRFSTVGTLTANPSLERASTGLALGPLSSNVRALPKTTSYH